MKVKRIGNHKLQLPNQHYIGDAGYDLRSTIDRVIIPEEQVLIPTGFAFEIPIGYVGIIKDRSSMASKYKMFTSAGVIDSTYRGEIHVCIRNKGQAPYKINIGDKIAQMIVLSYLTNHIHEVNKLYTSYRNDSGFGSTGK